LDWIKADKQKPASPSNVLVWDGWDLFVAYWNGARWAVDSSPFEDTWHHGNPNLAVSSPELITYWHDLPRPPDKPEL